MNKNSLFNSKFHRILVKGQTTQQEPKITKKMIKVSENLIYVMFQGVST